MREWQYWTRNKLEILAGYLPAFNTAAKDRSPERLYIDLMAGQPANRERARVMSLMVLPGWRCQPRHRLLD